MDTVRSRWVTGVNYLMLCVFILALAVQHNDPDSLLWMLIYGIAALACGLWRWTSIPKLWYTLIGGLSLAGGIYLLVIHYDQLSWQGMFSSVRMMNNSVEIIREAGGLFIIAVWMSVLRYHTDGGALNEKE